MVSSNLPIKSTPWQSSNGCKLQLCLSMSLQQVKGIIIADPVLHRDKATWTLPHLMPRQASLSDLEIVSLPNGCSIMAAEASSQRSCTRKHLYL